MTLIPFCVEKYMFYKGRRLYGFVAEGISKPGVIARMAEVIAERGMDITYWNTSTVRMGERGMDVFFVDFTDSGVDPEELAEELRGLDFVDRVEVIKPVVEGFIADDHTFPVMLGDQRAVILSEAALRGFLLDFRRSLGSGGEAMLYYLGRGVGWECAKSVSEEAERIGAGGLEERLRMGMKIFKSLGFGSIEILELGEEPPYLRVRVQSSIECELGKGAEKPFSHYVRGMLDGYSSQLFGREMLGEETRCLACGDPHCEFVIRTKVER